MEIRKSTWHYRLTDWVFTVYSPTSLCVYVLKVVSAVLVACFLTIAAIVVFVFGSAMATGGLAMIAAFVCLLLGVFPSFVDWASWVWLNQGPGWIVGYSMACFLGVIAYLAIGICLAMDRINDYLKNRPRQWLRPPKPPSLVVEYLKAKKLKVCPLIYFVE